MTNDDFAQESWQSSVTDAKLPSPDELRAASAGFHRKIVRRNAIEYVACAVVVVAFSVYVFTLEHVLQRIGAALVVAGTLFTGWQLHRRASSTPIEKAGATPIHLFMREQLVRQRDALAGVFWWYMLPFIPGMLVMTIGSATLQAQKHPDASPVPGLIVGTVIILVFVVIWWLNQRGARKLQRHIDDIDTLTRGKE